MTELPKPETIFTHESDLDGLVAGALLQKLAKKKFNRTIPLEAYHYNYWKQRDLRERSAWATDFAFDARMDKPEWLVVDHHATETPPKYAGLVHDINKSAGLLCYELCKENGIESPKLDRLVHLNNVADLFLENDADFALATDYANLVKVYQFWNLHTLIDGEIENLLDHPLLEVMAVKRRVEDPLGFEWSKKHILEISPTVGCMETLIGNTNLIMHQMLETKATNYAVLVTLFKRANNVVIASFRSRNGEALKVAEKLQGGGHANAAGALMPKAVRNIPDAIDYLRQVLQPKTTPGQTSQASQPLNAMESLFAGFEAGKK
ncbi:MAG TPA: DHH family phosphoesterase [Verrucomicrobiae bacterium]|jgi:oligoribonuclease NrnB/cAMP/cGMP phosphodiesterase (DHH superfamily)